MEGRGPSDDLGDLLCVRHGPVLREVRPPDQTVRPELRHELAEYFGRVAVGSAQVDGGRCDLEVEVCEGDERFQLRVVC